LVEDQASVPIARMRFPKTDDCCDLAGRGKTSASCPNPRLEVGFPLEPALLELPSCHASLSQGWNFPTTRESPPVQQALHCEIEQSSRLQRRREPSFGFWLAWEHPHRYQSKQRSASPPSGAEEPPEVAEGFQQA